MVSSRTIIIGAGPAGLAAGYELTKQQTLARKKTSHHSISYNNDDDRSASKHDVIEHDVIVLEQSGKVGGRSRYENYKGHTIDLNAAAFTTQLPEVQALWHDLLPTDFITAARLDRIIYRHRFFDYPLSFTNALKQLGPIDTALGALSYLQAKTQTSLFLSLETTSFDATAKDWLVERFGMHLYRLVFEPYLQKILGRSPAQLHSDWVSQVLSQLTLPAAIGASFSHSSGSTQPFDYPLLGPGMLWERCRTRIELMGAKVKIRTKVVQIERTGNRIDRVIVQRRRKRSKAAIASSKIAAQEITLSSVEGEQFISSLPLVELVSQLDPPAPPQVRKAAQQLAYRSIITVALIIDCASLFPDTTLYVQEPSLKVGRIQNYKNWSPAMVPNRQKTCLGMEYFCTQGDALWQMSNDDLVALASREVMKLGLTLTRSQIAEGTVVRQSHTHLVKTHDYYKPLAVVQAYLETFTNLKTVNSNERCNQNTPSDVGIGKHDCAVLVGLIAAHQILRRPTPVATAVTNIDREKIDGEQAEIPVP